MTAPIDGADQTKGGAGNEPSAPNAKQRKATKELRVLAELTRGPLHRFEAERIGDHCLPSTISALARRYGLRIERDWTRVPTRFGTEADVKRYWLADESRALALRLMSECALEHAP